MFSPAKMFVAFCETLLWTALAPYLVWQQWSGWLALGLLSWWVLYYWIPFFRLCRAHHELNKEAQKYPALIITEDSDNDSFEEPKLSDFGIDLLDRDDTADL